MKMRYYNKVFLFLNILYSTYALTMEGVLLQGDKDYIRLQQENTATLECKYTLAEGESVKVITWYHDDFMALKWGPPDPPEIGKGLEEGDAALNRDDGHLEFAVLRNGLEGIYRCEVMTSEGETFKSPNFQLLIIDMPIIPDMVKHQVEKCNIKFSWDAPAVKPKPDIMCGVWSEAHGYTLTATKWMATPYYNGSVAYSLDDEMFDILQMPLNSIIRCELKITKVDDTKVLLMEKDYNFTEVWERGCVPLEVGDGVHLEYDNERLTCHAEVKSKDSSAPVTAIVKCNEGFMPKYADYVSSVDMICKDTKWEVGGELTWNHFDNLLCVKTPKVPDRPPTPRESSSEDQKEEPSSSGNGVIIPWSLIVLLGILVISGVVWGIKNNTPTKKDPRYLA